MLAWTKKGMGEGRHEAKEVAATACKHWHGWPETSDAWGKVADGQARTTTVVRV